MRHRLLGDQRGSITPAVTAAVALALVWLMLVVNLLAVQYARGAVRAALDEGLRSGAVWGAGVAECQRRAADLLDDALGGPFGSRLQVACRVEGGSMLATAEGVLPSWLPLVPDFPLLLHSVSPLEEP